MAFEEISSGGVTEILNKLVPDVAQQITLAWGVKDDLRKLQKTMEMILAVIADAERRQVTEKAVRLWLRWLKHVAYDAEDTIDEFSYETTRRLLRGNNLKYKARDFVSSANPLAFRFKMARKIKHINQRLDEITKDMSRFYLQTTPASDTSVLLGESSEQRSRQTASYINDSDVIGREDDKERIINMLTRVIPSSSKSSDSNPEQVSVISIVGMGGLGKTSLAQLVYKDKLVNDHFQQTMWVHVSEDFDVEKLLTKIMESSTMKKFATLSNFDVLVRKVREQLNGKRYLLVLDDLWNEDAEQWEILRNALIVGAQGSKILTTTRKRQVADVVKGSIPPYFLEKLQDDECWSIMERRAFSPCGALKTPTMINIGKEIATKCSGLPLAAKFLGSLMHSKNSESNWLSIRENDMLNTPESKIVSILKLSYDNLSPPLQRCFSYCSIFPKEWELSKRILIQLWMAEGFLQPSTNAGNDCSFEDIGEEYFETLLWSSFFDGVKKNELDDVTTFKMHDLVHDLAEAVVGDHECSIVKDTDQLENIPEVRRLNLMLEKFSTSTKTFSNIKKLRTIIVFGRKYSFNLSRLSSNKHLRILHLGDPFKDNSKKKYRKTLRIRQLRYLQMSSIYLFGNFPFSRLYNLQTLVLSRCGHVQKHFKEIGSLKQLRHLDMSFSDIQELPDSVSSLHNLQTLDLNHCEKLTTFSESVTGLECLRILDMSFTPIEKLPDFVISLPSLRTLDVNTCKKLKTLPEYVAGLKNLRIFNFKGCPLLEALPEDFGGLSQLRYLSLEGTEIEVLPESCTNLRNLEYLYLGECELPTEVTNWINLRKFYFFNMETPKGIGKLVWLQELCYYVRQKDINGQAECSDGIQELRNLNFLEVLVIGDLQHVEDPIDAKRANLKGKQNLHELYLRWGETEEEEKELEMSSWDQNSCNFQVFDALQPPTCLKALFIENFMGSDLPTWMCTLQNLDLMSLQNCSEIKQLPPSIGQLPRLRYLTLKGIMSLESLDIGGFPSLVRLELKDMFLLEELCYSYPCLRYIGIDGCKSLTEIPSFPSLECLKLENVDPKLVCSLGRTQPSLLYLMLKNIEDLIYFPITILDNNRNLQGLGIEGCNQFQGFGFNDNLVNLFGPDLYSGGSIQTLEFSDCPLLKILPDLRGWTSLQKLFIWNCPQVKESLTYDLKSLSFLKQLVVDFIQRDEQRGDPSVVEDLVNLMDT